MPSSTDPQRDDVNVVAPAPVPTENRAAPKSNVLEDFTADGQSDDPSVVPGAGQVGPSEELPARVRSFESELRAVGNLPDPSELRAPDRADPVAPDRDRRSATSVAQDSGEHGRRREETGFAYAEGRNPLAEAYFGAEPTGDKPRDDFPVYNDLGEVHDPRDATEQASSAQASADFRTRNPQDIQDDAPQPVDFVNDVRVDLAGEAHPREAAVVDEDRVGVQRSRELRDELVSEFPAEEDHSVDPELDSSETSTAAEHDGEGADLDEVADSDDS